MKVSGQTIRFSFASPGRQGLFLKITHFVLPEGISYLALVFNQLKPVNIPYRNLFEVFVKRKVV